MQLRGAVKLMAAALVLLFSACASQAAPAPSVINVVMGDHYFKPDAIRLKAGQPVKIEFVNQGQVPHNLIAGHELQRLTWAGEHLDQDFFQGITVTHSEKKGGFGTGPHHATELLLDPGGNAALAFTVPTGKKGEWELGCLLPGHYESGMRATLIVD